MHKWWWWIPGHHKRWALERARVDVLSGITGERVAVEMMAQRPRDEVSDPLNETLLKRFLGLLRRLRPVLVKPLMLSILMICFGR
jgi:hypothetical protein